MSRFSKNSAPPRQIIQQAKSGFNTQNSILLVSILLIFWIVGYPLFMIVRNSIMVDGRLDFSAYAAVLTSLKTYKALLNTLLVAGGVLLLTGIMGGGLAVLVEKTDFRYQKPVRLLVFLEFCIPSYIIAVSWVQVTARGGYFHRLLKLIHPGASYTFSPYSWIAVIIVLSIHLYPLVFFGVSNALRKNRGVLENAARLAGGSPSKVFQTVTLPLVIPSMLSVGLLVLSRTMANFGIPAFLALPFGGEVLTTRIYKAISELDLQSLSVLSILLILISYSLYSLTERWVKRRAFYADASGRASARERIPLAKNAWVANLLVGVFFVLVLVIPLITLLLSSFMKRWGLAIRLENMTLHNYGLVLLQNSMMKRAFLNSLLYGTVSAGGGGLYSCYYSVFLSVCAFQILYAAGDGCFASVVCT